MLDLYLDAISAQLVGLVPPVGRALVQVLVTAILITLLANVVRAVGLRVAVQLPSVAQSSFRRDALAEAAASELLTEEKYARSILARNYVDRLPSTAGPSSRVWRRARKLQGPADERVLARWAQLGWIEKRASETISRTTALLGASAISSPRLLFRPLVLLISVAIVLWRRPPWRLPSMSTITDPIMTAVTDPRPSRVLPLALLVLGFLVVARPFPVIDRIRARDEAAKDANRLLAELYGQLTALEYALHKWREDLLAERHGRVARFVDEATGGQRSWGFGGGLVQDCRRVRPPLPPLGHLEPEAAGEGLTACIQAIELIDGLIRDKGLAVVARRLTWALRYPLGDLGLLHPWKLDAGLSRATHAPSVLYAPSLASYLAVAAPDVREALAPPILDDEMLGRIESEAFNLARVLDMSVADIFICQAQIKRVRRHLGGRMVGTWWTRTLSIVQK